MSWEKSRCNTMATGYVELCDIRVDPCCRRVGNDFRRDWSCTGMCKA